MDEKTKTLVERLINAATMHRKHPCEVYDMVRLANEAAATIRAQAEENERLKTDVGSSYPTMKDYWQNIIGGAYTPAKHGKHASVHPAVVGPVFNAVRGTEVADVIVGFIFWQHLTEQCADEAFKLASEQEVRAEAAEAERDALKAELARIKSAEGCDVEGALDAYMDAPNKGLPYDSLVQQRMSAALAAGCAPLRAKLALHETALRKIACWHVVAPEVNYPHYASMAVVTAREVVSQKEPANGNP